MGEREPVPGLATRLRAVREAAGLSQVEAEVRSGVHRISITRFETGKREPSIATLYQLARAYGVPVGDLLPPLAEVAAKADPPKARPVAKKPAGKRKPRAGG